MMKGKIFVLLMVLMKRVAPSQDVMRAITVDFTKRLDECKTEMALPDAITTDFSNFWKEGYEVNPTTGCVIICLLSKLNLLEPDASLNQGNALQFAKIHGADETLAKQLVDLLVQCETVAPADDEACLKVLGVTKCLKAEVQKLHWAPDMEVIAEEMLAEP